MVKKIISFLLSAICYLLLASHSYGKDFSSFYKTTYEFNKEGRAFVTQEVSLVNEKPDLYISEYTLSLNGTKIEEIQAFDKVGPVKVGKEVKDETTLIKLSFNEKALGKGKFLSFILKYQTPDLAAKRGNLWEISIPKLGNANEIDSFQVLLKIPSIFGKAAFINPKPDSEEKNENFYELTYNKDKLSNFGVLAVFGKWQTFDFELNFELENNSSSTAFGKIAIPPDTSFQDVYYESLTPIPRNVEVDDDGNWLAIYDVPSNTNLKIKAIGHVNIFSTPKKDFPQQKEHLDIYTKDDKYWEISNEKIKNLSTSLKTPKEIYEFVVKTLSYNKNTIENIPQRKGAVEALNNPQNCLCSEFTDLFIALCRAAGIPARELEGFAYTDNPKLNIAFPNKDLLHSWPEYYDTQKGHWVMVDPTFGNTASGFDFFENLDMSHFVFVTHGKSSQEPRPAGSYKNDTSQKQIFVSFGNELTKEKNPDFILNNFTPRKIYSLKNNLVSFSLKNNSGFAAYKQRFSFKGQAFAPYDFYVDVFPPYSIVEESSYLKPKENFLDYFLLSTLTINGQTLELKQKVISIGLRLGIVGGISLSLIIILILKSLKAKKV